jgi:hypothetical protein
MKKLRERINLGLKWPRKTPPAFEIPRAEAVPVIDGNISEPSWNSALTFNGSYPLDSLKKEDDGSIWKIMRDNEYIYVCAYFPDAELFATDRPGHPYRADSLEVFIMPSKRMKKYWEVVVGCDGDLFDGLHCNNRYGRWVSGPEAVMKGLKFKVLKQKAGYSVEIAIPFAELPNYMLGNKPRAGEVIYFALVKTDKDTENGKTKFYSAFPLLYGGHNIFGHAKGTLKK